MKSIVLFIGSLSSGGAEHQLIELSKLLIEKGYKVSIVTFTDVKDHYKIPEKSLRIKIGQGRCTLLKIILIMIFFVKIKTDCVISFGQRANLLAIIPLFFRRKIKIIAGERSLTIGKPTAIEKILTFSLYYRVDYIVPNSYSQAKYLISVNKKLVDKIKVITNYTDLCLYKATEYTPNTVIKIGIFARYSKEKNYYRFVKAIKLLKEKTNKSFVIEWFGNKYYKDNSVNKDYFLMEKMIEKYDLRDVFCLNSHIGNVSQVLTQYDAICLPSLFEGFSNSISEAISCARPMLVSDVSDNKLMVQEGINGFLFNPYDVDDIVNAILKFFNSTEDERNLMSINSRKIAEKLFDRDSFINKYVSLIN